MTAGITQPPGTIRLVSGVFYEIAPLRRGIDSLAASGFRRRDMCFIGTRTALAGLHAGVAEAPRKLRAVNVLWGEIEVMGTSGVLLEKLEKVAQRENESRFHSDGLLSGLFAKFTEHIRRNAVVLTVSAADPGSLQSGSLILLQHSAHPVQTHEFTLIHPTKTETAVVKAKN